MAGPKEHHYQVNLRWIGNRGPGTASYKAYDRTHEISVKGKAVITGSSDPAFLGDASLYNPEELLVASLSSCHMLWYLHLCADAGIVVTGYEDGASGLMQETIGGAAQFTSVVLRPAVTIQAGGDAGRAEELHARANGMCFIARSVNFPVSHEPNIVTEG